eukprot:scaffold4990_cov387-Prasinococcus_capsulatus_cf.AAC.31
MTQVGRENTLDHLPMLRTANDFQRVGGVLIPGFLAPTRFRWAIGILPLYSIDTPGSLLLRIMRRT